MKNYIRIHKEFNRSAIPFYREIAIDFFTEIMKRWNQSEQYCKLIFTEKELKEILNFKDYKELSNFLIQFTKDTVAEFTISSRKIIGTAFYFVRDEYNQVEVHLQEEIREVMFYRKDIELMKKNKHKLKMSISEIEEYRKNEKKYTQLMIFSQSDLLKFTGKYSKRLYMLLIQFRKSGKFFMPYEDLKRVLEIPETYRQCDIDRQIFKKSFEEFLKIGLEVIEFSKIKNGKKISKIEIKFKINNSQEYEQEQFKTVEMEKSEKINEDNLTELERKYLEKAKKIAKN